jgi:hypothetical protein
VIEALAAEARLPSLNVKRHSDAVRIQRRARHLVQFKTLSGATETFDFARRRKDWGFDDHPDELLVETSQHRFVMMDLPAEGESRGHIEVGDEDAARVIKLSISPRPEGIILPPESGRISAWRSPRPGDEGVRAEADLAPGVEPATSSAPPPIVPGDSPLEEVITLGDSPFAEPIVLGNRKSRLTPGQYRLVKALLDAHPGRLGKDTLARRAAVEDPVGMIDRLRKDPDWAAVLDKPGRAHGGYGIRTQ